jgi:SAM-dependent methyltransferase
VSQHDRWNEQYRTGNPPWDSGRTDPHLERFVAAQGLGGGRVLEIGCGTGTNAVWLASRGFSVVAVDVAPLAIERARARASAAQVTLELLVVDILREPLPAGPFDLAYDRGVLHVFDEPADRARVAAAVAGVLAPGARWLCLAGSTEGAPAEMGPPRRTLRELADAIEPHLALEEVRLGTFGDSADFPDPAPAWRLVLRKREMPAQPSTRRG